MTLGAPHWLLLVVPLGVMWWVLRPSGYWLRGLRAGVYGLVVLGMSEPRLWLPERAGTVVVVADRSVSLASDAGERQLEMIGLMHGAMSPDDRLAVVSFGREAAVEQEPAVSRLERFEQGVGEDASDLGAALRRALALIPADGSGRVLVLSDGRYTGTDPVAVGAVAATRGVAIDYRDMGRARAGDLAVLRVDAPDSVERGESFMITGWVQSPTDRRVSYELWRGERLIAQGERDLGAGVSRLGFRDRAGGGSGGGAEEGGTLGYRLVVRDAGEDVDPVPENNAGRFLVGVRGQKPVLLVTASPGQGLAGLMRRGGLEVRAVEPSGLAGTLEELTGYSAVVLENVSANDLPSGMLERLSGLVGASGTGLVMTGGQTSFGPGGYYGSALEGVLPVSMELRQEHRKLSLAMVVALDRSGSMGVPVGGGRTKMDLANLGTAKVVDLLSPLDELGVLAVDSAPHTVVPMAPVTDKSGIKSRVLRIRSMGGGIFVYEALAEAAGMLVAATPTTRHIILFSDAQDSEEPGRYRELLEKAAKANITVSVIGLGKPSDVDAPLLRDIAARGGGRVFFTEDPNKLPQLFAQDTFVVARSSFVDEVTPVSSTAVLSAMTGRSLGDPRPVGGYNLTYLKPEAQLAVVTEDQYKAPLVAAWRAGLGRVATYAGEADGEFTGPIALWPGLGELMTSLGRWVLATDRRLPETMLARQRVDGGLLRVELMLDPERPDQGLVTEPEVSVLRGRPGVEGGPERLRLRMRYTSPHTLAAEVPLSGDAVAVATLDAGELGRVTLSPARLLYSPEYVPRSTDGLDTLRRLASMTGGSQRVELGAVWDELVPVPRFVSVAHWVWLLAVVAVLVEVLERRTSWVSQGVMMVAGWFVFARRRNATSVESGRSTGTEDPHPNPARPRVETSGMQHQATDSLAVSKKSNQGKRQKAPGQDIAPELDSSPTTPVDGLTTALGRARQEAANRLRSK
ncbi:MAG: VWA domain-containing protein [Planctomycetota bacterium]